MLGSCSRSGPYQQPVLSLLAGTSVTFVTAGVRLAGVGIAIATLVQLVVMSLTEGLAFVAPWAPAAAAYALAGALAFGIFLLGSRPAA